MPSYECYKAYIEQYGGGSCFLLAPTETFQLRIDGKKYIEPVPWESDEVFMDRLKRSIEQGENLFAKEWPEYKPIDWSDPKWANRLI